MCFKPLTRRWMFSNSLKICVAVFYNSEEGIQYLLLCRFLEFWIWVLSKPPPRLLHKLLETLSYAIQNPVTSSQAIHSLICFTFLFFFIFVLNFFWGDVNARITFQSLHMEHEPLRIRSHAFFLLSGLHFASFSPLWFPSHHKQNLFICHLILLEPLLRCDSVLSSFSSSFFFFPFLVRSEYK